MGGDFVACGLNDSKGYAVGSVAAGIVSFAEQAQVEEPDQASHTTAALWVDWGRSEARESKPEIMHGEMGCTEPQAWQNNATKLALYVINM